MADRLYVTVTDETRVLYEMDYPLSRMPEAAHEFSRVLKIAEEIGQEPNAEFRAVSLTINHELPQIFYYETTGIKSINGRNVWAK